MVQLVAIQLALCSGHDYFTLCFAEDGQKLKRVCLWIFLAIVMFLFFVHPSSRTWQYIERELPKVPFSLPVMIIVSYSVCVCVCECLWTVILFV